MTVAVQQLSSLGFGNALSTSEKHGAEVSGPLRFHHWPIQKGLENRQFVDSSSTTLGSCDPTMSVHTTARTASYGGPWKGSTYGVVGSSHLFPS